MKTILSVTLGLALAIGLTGCNIVRDTGLWRGTVVVRDELRAPYTCEVEIDLTHTDDTLAIHHLLTSCNAYSSKWHPGTFELLGSSAWKNGRNIGWAREDGSANLELDDNTADERFPMPSNRVILSWVRVGEGIEFTQETYYAGRIQRSTGLLRKTR